nr:hypothetical protein [Allomuricauda sp.]
MAAQAKFPSEGFPYEIALRIKNHYENELFQNDSVGNLSLEELLDENKQKTNRYIINAGVYQARKIPKEGDIFTYSKVPQFLAVPEELLPKKTVHTDGAVQAPQDRIRVIVHFTEKFYATAKPVRPLIGGISCMHFEYDEAGTLGGKVKLQNEPGKYFISNWHVLVGSNGALDDEILQPGRRDGGQYKHHQVGRVVYYRLDEHMDVAIAEVIEDIPIKGGIKSIEVNGTAVPRVGQKVEKYGKSTKRTTGEILKVDYSVEVFSEQYFPEGKKTFKNQVLCEMKSRQGDSGSVVVDSDSKNAVGILFAVNTGNNLSVANKLDFSLPRGKSAQYSSKLKKDPVIESFN